MQRFKHYVTEGIFGKVGEQANKLKTKYIGHQLPKPIRSGMTRLIVMGAKHSAKEDGDTDRFNKLDKFSKQLKSGRGVPKLPARSSAK